MKTEIKEKVLRESLTKKERKFIDSWDIKWMDKAIKKAMDLTLAEVSKVINSIPEHEITKLYKMTKNAIVFKKELKQKLGIK